MNSHERTQNCLRSPPAPFLGRAEGHRKRRAEAGRRRDEPFWRAEGGKFHCSETSWMRGNLETRRRVTGWGLRQNAGRGKGSESWSEHVLRGFHYGQVGGDEMMEYDKICMKEALLSPITRGD